MDTEVSRTLAELERKLHDLELALASVGGEQRAQGVHMQAASSVEQATSSDSPSPRPPSGARLVDESVDLSAGGQGHAEAQGDAGAQGPAGEQGHAGAQDHPGKQGDAGRQSEEHPNRPADESIELVELVRFRDRLERTMRDLVEDYERVIRLRAASQQPHTPIDER